MRPLRADPRSAIWLLEFFSFLNPLNPFAPSRRRSSSTGAKDYAVASFHRLLAFRLYRHPVQQRLQLLLGKPIKMEAATASSNPLTASEGRPVRPIPGLFGLGPSRWSLGLDSMLYRCCKRWLQLPSCPAIHGRFPPPASIQTAAPAAGAR
jgi:hypothetical protein